MIAVIDASPLLALARLDQLSLLSQLFTQVLVPLAVSGEVLRGRPTAADVSPIREAIEAGHITLHRVDSPMRDAPASLGLGEREVVAAALALSADAVIVDDYAARRAAEGLGLTVIGTVGVLVRARRAGLVSNVGPMLDVLVERGFYLAPALIDEARRGDLDGGGKP